MKYLKRVRRMQNKTLTVRKVLMTADAVGGVFSYCLELARALVPLGAETCLAVMGGPLRPGQREEAADIPGLELLESGFRLEWMEDPWHDVEDAGAWLLEIEKETGPDLVHLNGYAHGALPWKSPIIVVGHSCVLSWWRAVHGGTAPGMQRYRQAVYSGLGGADLVVAPSGAMLDCLREHYGRIFAGRIVYNGIGQGTFRAGKKEDFILTAGRLWDEGKNSAALAAAAPFLPWPIYAAGSGGAAGRSAMEGIGPGQNSVQPLGFLSRIELASWYARAAIYVLPALYEPFGLTVLEAALSGCVLVLGDIPSLREIWGDAAIFVEPRDVIKLQTTILGLIKDKSRREEMSGRALRRAMEYDSRKMALGYLALYDELLNGGFEKKATQKI